MAGNKGNGGDGGEPKQLSCRKKIQNNELKDTLFGLRELQSHNLRVPLQTFILTIVKWALCSFGEEIKSQNLNIYSINEVIIQTHLFFPYLNKQAVCRGK